MDTLFQASHIVAGEATGRQATAVVRPESLDRYTIPQDGERSMPGRPETELHTAQRSAHETVPHSAQHLSTMHCPVWDGPPGANGTASRLAWVAQDFELSWRSRH